MAYKIKSKKLKKEEEYQITKNMLERARFKAEIEGGWVNKEVYRRLKASYKTQEGLK